MNPKYMPKPIPGYVFHSNFGATELGTDAPRSVESITATLSVKYDVPVEDIIVAEMIPSDAVKFSVYFAVKHQAKTARLIKQVETLLAAMRPWRILK